MANLVKLTDNEMDKALGYAIEQHVPLTVTIHHQNRWLTFQSKMLTAAGELLWVKFPTLNDAAIAYDFRQGEEVGVTFRKDHQRFVFAVPVNGKEDDYKVDGQGLTALRLDKPREINWTQRRAHQRVDMPAEAMVRASFWLGGWQAQPNEPTVSSPVWSGRVMDLSAGGCFIRTNSEAARYMEVGDIVGLRITFGADNQEVLLDGQFRHSAPDGRMALVGFQFVDVDETPTSSHAWEVIKKKVSEMAL